MNLALLTVCDDPWHPGLRRLGESLARWRWDTPLVTHTVRPWRGTWSKVVGLREALPTIRSKGVSHLLLTDGYDVVANGPEDELYRHVPPAGALFSAECWCWPAPELEPLYPPAPTPYRFLNSGGYLAEIEYLGDYLLAGPDLTPDQTGGRPDLCREDQTWFTHKFLGDPANCRLDYRCEVFQTLGSGVVTDDRPHYVTFDFVTGRVRNKDTGTTPLFVHGNGRADMTWLEVG